MLIFRLTFADSIHMFLLLLTLVGKKAVAYYTGALEQTSSKGYLLYTVADQMCARFGTCVGEGYNDLQGNRDLSFATAFANSSSVATALVNIEMFILFEEGQRSLLEGKCSEARQTKDKIVRLMTVPLVQGLLRAAHTLDVQQGTKTRAVADGATFSASVLPLVHACNVSDGIIIHEFMNVDRGMSGRSVDFQQVKSALERNYKCMGITCKEVGGLLQPTGSGNYQNGASPCDDHDISSNYNNAAAFSLEYYEIFQIVTLILIAIAVFCAFAFHIFVAVRQKKIIRNARRDVSTRDDTTVGSYIGKSLTSLEVVFEQEKNNKGSVPPKTIDLPIKSKFSYSPEEDDFDKLFEEEFGKTKTARWKATSEKNVV